MRRDHYDVEEVQCDRCPRTRIRRVNPNTTSVTCVSCAAKMRVARERRIVTLLKEEVGSRRLAEIIAEVDQPAAYLNTWYPLAEGSLRPEVASG